MKTPKTLAYQFDKGRCKGHRFTFKEANALWQVPDNIHIYEVKENGIRYFLQIRPNGADHNFLVGDRISKRTGLRTEAQNKSPRIRDYKFCVDMHDVVLDGEIVGGNDHSDAVSALTNDTARFVVWDIVWRHSQDLRQESLAFRWKLLQSLVPAFAPWMRLIKRDKDPRVISKYVLENSLEGWVRKNEQCEYGEEWQKVKEEDNYDAVIWGYLASKKGTEWAKKKLIGSLRIGQWVRIKPGEEINKFNVLDSPATPPYPGNILYRNNAYFRFVDVGRCSSGFDMKQRKAYTENKSAYMGAVIELKCQKRLKSGHFEHPRMFRPRPDKASCDCILVLD